VFRLATAEDGDELAALAMSAYGGYLDQLAEPPAPMLLDYAVVAAANRTHVAVRDGVIAGMVTVEEDGTDLVLRNLAVLPSFQGRGIGRGMVAFVERLARERGHHCIRLWTRVEMRANIDFYVALDYAVTHTEQGGGANRIFFRKEIAPDPTTRTGGRVMNRSTQ
jgi:ribosomal protein S18 acetylase RimI-like enzyme